MKKKNPCKHTGDLFFSKIYSTTVVFKLNKYNQMSSSLFNEDLDESEPDSWIVKCALCKKAWKVKNTKALPSVISDRYYERTEY